MADVLFGVETQHFPNPKPKNPKCLFASLKGFLSFTKEEVSLALSLSLFIRSGEKNEDNDEIVFFIVERCRHRESNIKKFKRAKRENWNWKLPARGNISVRAKALEEEEEKRGGCREETNDNNNTKTTDQC